MEKEQKLNKYQFKVEIEKMAVSCIGNKESTAKSKAKKLFEKYKELIGWSIAHMNYYENEYNKLSQINKVLKTGKIIYSRKIDQADGFLLIKDIEQIEAWENDLESAVIVTMKSGRKVKFGSTFKYLLNIF